jgi:hypothetical protein
VYLLRLLGIRLLATPAPSPERAWLGLRAEQIELALPRHLRRYVVIDDHATTFAHSGGERNTFRLS